jgi:DNA-binding MarR family transcriptional regulator
VIPPLYFHQEEALGYLLQVGRYGSITIPKRCAGHLLLRGLVAPSRNPSAGARKRYHLTDKGEDARARMLRAATIEHADTEPPDAS